MKMEGVETFERAEDDVDGTVDAERSTSTLYQLVGVIVHQGATANSGHYITLVKDEDRKSALFVIMYFSSFPLEFPSKL